MAEALGSVYVEIAAKADKILSTFRDIEQKASQSARGIEDSFSRTRVSINNSMAQKSLQDVQSMYTTLKAKLEQKITLNADMASIDRTRNALQTVEAKLAGLQQTASKTKIAPQEGLSGMFGGFDAGIGKMVTSMASFLAVTFSVQRAWQFLGESFEQFENRKKAMLGVESTLKSMGLQGEYTASSILKMATGLAQFNSYAVKTNEVLDLSTFLLTFDNISKDTLPRATQIVIDLSRKMDTDLKGAALSVGIALDNPAEGLMRLGRAGIKFSKDERDVIQALVDSGNAAAAQEAIFDKLEKKVGGFARNTTDDFDKYTGQIKAAMAVGQRSIGSFIESALEPLAKSIADAMPKDLSSEYERLSQKITEQNGPVQEAIASYDKLNGYTNLNKEQQEELSGAIVTLSAAFPSAILQWDEYGKAIGISTDKIRENIVAEQERLKYLNAQQIEKTKGDIQEIDATLGIKESQARQGGVKIASSPGSGRSAAVTGGIRPFTAEESAEIQREIEALGEAKRGAEGQLRKLMGESTVTPVGGKGASGSKSAINDNLKAQLDAEREVQAARMRILEEAIAERFEREKKTIDDRKVLALQALSDEEKAATKEKPVDPKVTASKRLAIELTYTADVAKLHRDVTADEVTQLKAREAFEVSTNNERKSFNRQLVDQRIRDFALTTREFKKYLDDQLALEIENLNARNTAIDAFNEKNKGKQGFRPVEKFDVKAFKSAGEKENSLQAADYGSSQKEHLDSQWKKNNKEIAQGFDIMTQGMTLGWSSALEDMLKGTQNFGEGMNAVWNSMKASMISAIAQVISEMTVLWVIKTALTTAGNAIMPAFGFAGHAGGEFVGGSSGVMKLASGGSFIVPRGFEGDKFPLMVESGERVSVTPASKTAAQQTDYTAMLQKLDILNMNLATSSRDREVSGSIRVETVGKTDGQDIYTVNKKAARVYARTR